MNRRTLFGRAIAAGGKILADQRLAVFLAVLAPLLLLRALGAGWQLDDHFHRSRILGYGDANPIQIFVPYDGIREHNLKQMEVGTLPWWASPDLHLAFLRYGSTLTTLLDYQLWPNHPEWMHLHSLLWLSAVVIAATLLYRRILGSTWVAGLAALLYAVDDAHAMPTVYLANRNALIASCFGFLSVLAYARSRQPPSRWYGVVSAFLLALALSAGEMALATAAYLFAYALILERGTTRQKLVPLLPHAAVLGAWALAYRLGDYGSHGSGFYLDPLRSPLSFAAGFVERAPLLLMGQWTLIPASMGLVFAPGSREALELRFFSLTILGVLTALLIPLMLRNRVARFWGLAVLLSLLPIAAVGPEDRLLFFVGLGSMGLLAQLVQTAFASDPKAPASIGWQRFARIAVMFLLPLHMLVAPALGVAWIGYQAKVSEAMLSAIASVPTDSQIAGQDLVLVNPPDHVYLVTAIPVVKQLETLPAPKSVRALSSGSALEITRNGARSLRVRFPMGFFPTVFSRYMRSQDDSFRVGQRIDLPRLSVEVESLDANGDPDEVLYEFAVPLEDSSLRWMRWQDGAYVAWRPPEVGETERLAPSRGIFG